MKEQNNIKLNLRGRARQTGVKLGKYMSTNGKQNIVIIVAILIVLSIIGSSGSGKTTFFNVMDALLSADVKRLKNYNIESRREINNIYIEKPNETLQKLFNTDEDMLARDYVIIHKNEILMWIKETFPISYFR